VVPAGGAPVSDRPSGALSSGAVTAAALAVQTGLASVVGVIIGREFGHGAETDGFFAAYGVFIVLVLVANAVRVVVLPRLAEARPRGALGSELLAYALALTVVAAPILVAAELAPDRLADLLTGTGGEVAQSAASDTLRWMVPAAVAQLYAGLAASALAALDDYRSAALGYALGSVLGLALILLRVDADGIVAVSWGMALNGAVALLVPALVLLRRRGAIAAPRPEPAAEPPVRVSGPAEGVWGRPRSGPSAQPTRGRGLGKPGGSPSSARSAHREVPPARLQSRLWEFVRGSAVPLAVQALYVICLPLASREGEGAVTSFGYAYLIASALVAVTASSLGLVSSVPLARSGLGPVRAARHVVSTSWIALAIVAPAAGVFAVAGGSLLRAVLGSAYGADVGSDLGLLVLAFGPFMVVSAAFSVTFPLVFVDRRERALPFIAIGALAVQLPLAWLLGRELGLYGLAAALTVTTFGLLVVTLVELGALAGVLRGLAIATATFVAVAGAAFGLSALLLPDAVAAVIGVVGYAALLALVRPRGLRAAWAYLHALE
jgi:O-antigen/teichoic acid export membrane protein